MEKRKGFYSVAKKANPRKTASGKTKKAVGSVKRTVKKSVKKVVKKAVGKAAAKAVAKKAKKTVKAKSVKSAGTTRKAAPKKAVKKVAKKASTPTVKAAKPKPKKVRNPLKKKELKEFHKLLLAKRRELVGDMTGIEAEALGADRQESKGDISDHPADAGTDNFEQEFSLGLLESERNMLAEIDQALNRIEEGTYGICAGTGEPIGMARLTARPWAPYSIEYARMVEKGLVRAGERLDVDDED